MTDEPLRILIHAPTPSALDRARSNARNALKAEPTAQVRIVVNARAVGRAIDTPDPATDGLLVLCANSLARQELKAPEGFRVVPAAVIEIARLQREGWLYQRA